MTITAARIIVAAVYRAARLSGESRDAAAQAAWMAYRQLPSNRALRAPRWDEQLHDNTGSRRSYTSPLGAVLGCDHIYGQHSAKWPRTRRSEREAQSVAADVLRRISAPALTRAALTLLRLCGDERDIATVARVAEALVPAYERDIADARRAKLAPVAESLRHVCAAIAIRQADRDDATNWRPAPRLVEAA